MEDNNEKLMQEAYATMLEVYARGIREGKYKVTFTEQNREFESRCNPETTFWERRFSGKSSVRMAFEETPGEWWVVKCRVCEQPNCETVHPCTCGVGEEASGHKLWCGRPAPIP